MSVIPYIYLFDWSFYAALKNISIWIFDGGQRYGRKKPGSANRARHEQCANVNTQTNRLISALLSCYHNVRCSSIIEIFVTRA